MSENKFVGMLSKLEEILLMIIDGKVGKLFQDNINLRVGFSELLRL